MSLQNIPLALTLVLMNTVSVGMLVYKLPYLRKYFTDEEIPSNFAFTLGNAAEHQASKPFQKDPNERLVNRDRVYNSFGKNRIVKLPVEKINAWRDEHSILTVKTMLNVINTIQKEMSDESSCKICLLTMRKPSWDLMSTRAKEGNVRKCTKWGKVSPIYTTRKRGYRPSRKLVNLKKRNLHKRISYIAFDGNKSFPSSQQLIISQSFQEETPLSVPITPSGFGQATGDLDHSNSSANSCDTIVDLRVKLLPENDPYHSERMTLISEEMAVRCTLETEENQLREVISDCLEMCLDVVTNDSLEGIEGAARNDPIGDSGEQTELGKVVIDTALKCISGEFGFIACPGSKPTESSRISIDCMRNANTCSWNLNPCEMRDLESLKKIFVSKQVLSHFNVTTFVNIPGSLLLHPDEPSSSRDICLPDSFAEDLMKDSNLFKTQQPCKSTHQDDDVVPGDDTQSRTNYSPSLSDPDELEQQDKDDVGPVKVDDDCFTMAKSTLDEDTPSTSGVSFVTAEEDDGSKPKKKKIKRIFSSLLRRSKHSKIALKNKRDSSTVENKLVPPVTTSRRWFKRTKKPKAEN